MGYSYGYGYRYPGDRNHDCLGTGLYIPAGKRGDLLCHWPGLVLFYHCGFYRQCDPLPVPEEIRRCASAGYRIRGHTGLKPVRDCRSDLRSADPVLLYDAHPYI
ncbi:hypothetical protein D3C87_1503550 [compost metagenome]